MYPLLSQINSPEDLKKLQKNQLEQVCAELREFIIDEVSQNPGHFGASLGVVELTVALHYVLNTPHDNLVWDVGHQAYAHKLLTGRREQFHTNRQYKGLSGFPKRSESPYDCFGVGHASTSISSALGMAVASKLQGDDKQTVAVIGDGSMTGGLAFEGLNNVAINRPNLLIILNDNNMAIDPVTGGLNKYLVDITSSKTYNRMRKDIWHFLGKLDALKPNPRKVLKNMEGSVKSFLMKEANIFEALDIRYFGPVDGHDVKRLVSVLDDLKNLKGPRLLHIVTQKGKGFSYAEKDQTVWHAPGLFDKETGVIVKNPQDKNKPPKFQDVFGHTLVELAKQNEKIVGITPAMPSGSSMNIMMEAFPERSFDVGIAEGHSVTFSAGLATQGFLPFCNVYSSFMQRAYDNVIHDVALQNLDVVFCLDRGGLVGADGATHHGAYDLAYFRCIPNMIVSAPMDEIELRNLMYTAQLGGYGAFSIRYPRGRGSIVDWQQPFEKIEIGKGRQLVKGEKLAILSIGAIGTEVSKAISELAEQNIAVSHYDMRFVKPLDTELLMTIFANYDKIVTVEDGTILGGFGSAVLEFANAQNYKGTIKHLGIPDTFIEQGTQQELYAECGYDKAGILGAVKVLLEN
ncbi:MAG: 1-deoxy-D-xylulose-5-phosphate synthase [Flavobacteriaceae bacterium]|nr:1-deoxy-D-xylulose-5-phosphate synthase [Flavobacteriaceae bacterium]MBS9767883.1 1-deoxy-D-xylulose-5-phosphate synthase [Flavobacteriaceae bacterium]